MGATLSNLTEGGYADGGGGPGLGDIPESCVACVFMHLTPPEICNLARLNRAFRGAASADSVWEPKLPPNYQALLRKLPADHPADAAALSSPRRTSSPSSPAPSPSTTPLRKFGWIN